MILERKRINRKKVISDFEIENKFRKSSKSNIRTKIGIKPPIHISLFGQIPIKCYICSIKELFPQNLIAL
ncbi:MAG: hypothetical protein ACI85O_000254 [Saprospiraceae bacterium]